MGPELIRTAAGGPWPPALRSGLFCLLVLWAAAATAAAPPFDRREALATSQGVIGRPLGDHVLRRRDGSPLSLAELRGRPLVVSLIYTACQHICPTTTQHLQQAVQRARAVLGTDSFRVVTVGFDTAHDTPAAMREFARQRGITEPEWYFLSADPATLERLAADLGFLYAPSPHGFDHLIQATIVDADGVIYRQVYGMNFDLPLFVEPLKALVLGRPAGRGLLTDLANRVRLFCTVYDPAANRYHYDFSLLIGIIVGALSIGLVATWLVREWRGARSV